MNQKQIKQYSLIENIFKLPFGSPTTPQLFSELAGISFETAADIWEYVLNQNAAALSNTANANIMVGEILDNLIKQSIQKTTNYICDSLPLIKLLYGNNACAGDGDTLAILCNLIVANKVEIADTMLSALKNNSVVDFNEKMKEVVERVFAIYCTKNNTLKPELNRKQKSLLLEFIEKIKGPNKALLQQRIKEL